ncbi:Outer membrane biogenesis protein BamB [Planctomycetales bacterium 10988]|nr:Outer membrane biogenesis protein BamB [Planctomycetales bacterium 10988]
MSFSLSRRELLAASAAALATGGLCQRALATTRRVQEWRTWRGPTRNNHAPAGNQLPTELTPDTIQWRLALPGRGHSSPIIVGDSLFLSTADELQRTQSVLGIDLNTRKISWTETIHQGGLPRENHPKNTEASATLASDGEHLFACFYNSSRIFLTALDLNGKKIWQEDLGPFDPQRYKFGYGPSPALYGKTVIVAAEHDGPSFITARDCETGQVVWQIDRPNNITFSSPIVANVAGREQLLISGSNAITSYDPSNGKMLWTSRGMTAATCGTMVWDDERVFASGGYPDQVTECILADGSGKKVWSNSQKSYEQSMLVVGDYLYTATDSGIAYCWRASDGRTMWRARLGGDFSSSPVLVNDVIYVFNEEGTCFVFKANPQKFDSLGEYKLGDEAFATPAVINNKMYMRVADFQGRQRAESLLCIA